MESIGADPRVRREVATMLPGLLAARRAEATAHLAAGGLMALGSLAILLSPGPAARRILGDDGWEARITCQGCALPFLPIGLMWAALHAHDCAMAWLAPRAYLLETLDRMGEIVHGR